MIKKFLTMALVAVTLSASTAFAQTASDNQNEPAQQETRMKGDKKDRKDKKDKKDNKGKKGGKDRKDRKGGQSCDQACQGGQCAFNPFEGLNLTEEQQTQLNQLREQAQAQRQAQAEARKANAEARKEQKQQNDSARFAERRAAKAERLNQIKGILTPEQYVQFLENSFLNAPANGKGIKPGKGMKGGDRNGQKPGKDRKDKKDRKGGNDRKDRK